MSFSILAILGPTASGKSDLAIAIANSLKHQGLEPEIINADAMQLYRGMDIGTAKLSVAEMGGIPHHLIGILEPSQEMTAVEYQALARSKAEELIGSGKLPIFVGGSMFYVSAALDNLDFAPTDPEIRERLEAEASLLGALTMHERLSQLDSETAKRIPAQNQRRVIRALEVIQITGEKYSSQLPEPVFWKPTLQLGILVDREVIKERIATRVQKMWEMGILNEAKSLLEQGGLSRTAKVAIGYEQAFKQLKGSYAEQEAIAETISLTQRYARRQMSWFRRDKRTKWLDSNGDLLEQALEQIRLEQ